METIEINNHKINIYTSAEDLPIKRYTKFQKYVTMESGIGSDMESIASHLKKLFEFNTYKRHEEALQEAKNLYYNFYVIFEEIPVNGLAFACLVYSIDGEVITDITEKSLEQVVTRLSNIGLTAGTINDIIETTKKKVHKELKVYIPSFFNQEETFKFYANVKSKILALAKAIDGENVDEEIYKINEFFVDYSKPENFDSDSEDNALVRIDRTFENLCAALESNGVSNAADITTLQFYTRLEYFKKVSTSIKSNVV